MNGARWLLYEDRLYRLVSLLVLNDMKISLIYFQLPDNSIKTLWSQMTKNSKDLTKYAVKYQRIYE